MIRLFFIGCLLIGSSTFAQTSNKSLQQMSRDIEAARKKLDSDMKATDSILAHSNQLMDSADRVREQERNNRNLSNFVREYNQQQRKREKQMWIRIGFGIAMLIVLLIGLFRKRKKKEAV